MGLAFALTTSVLSEFSLDAPVALEDQIVYRSRAYLHGIVWYQSEMTFLCVCGFRCNFRRVYGEVQGI